MKAETLESYRPLLRGILNLEGFQFENVFSFRVKGEDIVDALSGKSEFFDIGTKGNKLLKTLYQKWKASQRPASVILKDHIMSIFPIREDVEGMDFLGMLRDRGDGELTTKEENLIHLICSEFAAGRGPRAESPGASGGDEDMLTVEREAHQHEVRQILLRTRELEESLKAAEENLSSMQQLAEHLQETASREQQGRVKAEDRVKLLESQAGAHREPATDTQRLTAEMGALQSERDELGSQVQTLQAELADLRETLDRLQEERSTDHMQYSNELETLMGNLSEIQVREQELRMQLDSAEKERNALRGQLASAANEAAAEGRAAEEAERLSRDLAAVRADLAQRESQLHETAGHRAELSREIQDLRDAVEAREGELRGVRAALEAKEAQVEQARSTLDLREADLEQEKNITANLFQELEGVRTERDDAILKAEGVEAQLADLRKVSDRVEELEEALQVMEGRFQEASDLLGTVMKSRDKYRSVLDSEVNPIFMLDRHLTVLHLNRAMLSYTREHQFTGIIGKRCYESLGLRGICPGCPILKTVESGHLESNLVPMEMDGETRLFSISAFPTLDADANVTAVTEFMEEVTDRVAAVEQLHKVNAERQRLTSRMEASPLSYLRILLDSLGAAPGSGSQSEGSTDFEIKP